MNKFYAVKQEMMKKEDKLGKKIDLGILDLVVVLNCFGFETISSCEGHPEEGLTFFPEVCMMTERGKNEKIQDCWHRNLVMQKKIIALLQEFYLHRETDYQHRLITDIHLGLAFSIRPHSGYLTKILKNKKERNELHRIYTKEIQEFTDFLKRQL